jgi:hypothetical protein
MRTPGRRTGSLAAGAVLLTLLASVGLVLSMAAAAGRVPQAEAAPAAGLRSTEVGPLGPTPTPMGLQGLARMTEPGCCILAGWMPDSSAFLVLASPRPDTPAALMAVPLAGGPRRQVWEQPAVLSPDGALALQAAADRVRFTRLADGSWWTIYTAGREPLVSPSGKYVTWDVYSRGISHPDVREHALWVAEVTGSKPRRLAALIGGELVGWGAGETVLIATGRLGATGKEGVWAIPLDSSEPVLLHEVLRPRDPLLSAGGEWLAFYVAFTGDGGQNGLWVLRTDGTSLSKVTPFGSYRWRAEGRLLLIPLGEGTAPRLFEVDAAAGKALELTDPQRTSLPIANNDWSVSPDGRHVAFTSWTDRAIWVLDLP